MTNPRHNIRDVYPDTGTEISAKSWLTEAPMRMLMNNLHPDVAENPHELVVYGGIGRAARTWEDFDAIVAGLKELEDDQTMLVQSGKPVGIFRTHKDAPRVLIDADEVLWLNDQEITLEALEQPLVAAFEQASDPESFSIAVKADGQVPVETLQAVMRSIKAAGFRRITLLTQPSGEAP